ncbi:GNAT family N-acetyltransferase [Muricoccus radiodurans]|uniref:GNAT family N-acetyltransferase n=1 Tax=Muricoccus radiodurans TaxID=2231721 RepID=UPI003CF04C61
MNGPVLTTDRLVLRPPVLADLDGWAALMADPVAARFIGGPQSRTVAWRGLTSAAGSWAVQGFGPFSVVERASGRWIGRIGPWRPEGWPGDEIGWALDRGAWGRGLAREGAAATMEWARTALRWREVIHVVHPDNAPSRALAGRLGSRLLRLGRLPPPFDAEALEIWGQSLRAG